MAQTVSSRRAALQLAAAFGFFAVMAGAFAAHGLDGQPAVWMEKASRYAMWHALALLAAAALELATVPVVTAFGLGVLLFSGSLTALALGAPRKIALITPFGGFALLAGWLLLGLTAWRRGRRGR